MMVGGWRFEVTDLRLAVNTWGLMITVWQQEVCGGVFASNGW